MTAALLLAEPESATRGYLERQLANDGFHVLQAAFGEFSKMTYDLRVAVNGVVIAADGLTASVDASETIRPVAKSVRVEPRTGTALFQLKKTGGEWSIQSVKSDVRK